MITRYNRARSGRIGRSRETIAVTGFDELYKTLSEALPKATARGDLQRAGKAAMQPVMDRIEENAPERTGQTKASVRMSVKLLKATAHFGAAIRVQVGVGSKKIFWPRFAERGTVNEPARPFVRPAFDAEKVAVLERLKPILQAEIAKSIARRARRLAKRG